MAEMIPHYILPLQLNDLERKQLAELNEALGEKLEKYGSLRPEMMADLTASMKVVLAKQPIFIEAQASAQNLQTLLHLTHPDPAILNLPWRLATETFPLLHLSKGRPLDGPLPGLDLRKPPLKILVMISSPENERWENRLSYEEEEDEIISAFGPLFDSGHVQIDFTDDGSLENLREKLAANHYHIVHFSGHGIFHKGTGYLSLEDPMDMDQQFVTAEVFARVFQEKPEHLPALVVLNSCQTSKGELEEGMKSVAEELLLKGLPAVIAMSVSVTDYFATYFAGVLYQELGRKEPLHRAFKKAILQTRQYEQQKVPQFLPSQWMIPQLFMGRRVEQMVDWTKADETLYYAASKFVLGELGLQTQKQEGYYFVGRRRDRKRIFPELKQKRAVLLKGQGGVGKTAMAEYILQRLLAANSSIHPFVFNETNASLENINNSLKAYLKSKKKRKAVLDIENQHQDDAFKTFQYLLAEVEDSCTPLFIFDNLESFQSAPGKNFQAIYADNLGQMITELYESEHYLILTCRYSVAECPDISSFDLNQVTRNDFLKKALQLYLKKLPRKIEHKGLSNLLGDQLSFQKVIDWLHTTFGGNYRALEFFDELFKEREEQLPQTLQTLANFRKEYAEAAETTRQQMSQNLLFEELLKLLGEEERYCLQLLTHFRIPVLTTALQMQHHELDYPHWLNTLLELTLLEQHKILGQEHQLYYYLTPLIKDLTTCAFPQPIPFSTEQAGRYHYWMDQEVNDQNYNDLLEAFHFFALAKNGAMLNTIGSTLCDFFYSRAQYQRALQLGLEVYELNQRDTNWMILNLLGIIHNIFGKGEEALGFYRLCETQLEIEEDLEKKGVLLNNISQIYSAQGDYENALLYLEKSLVVRQEIGDKSGEGTTLNNIGLIYKAQGDYKRALSYLEKSLVIVQEIGNKSVEGATLNNISLIYKTWGDYNSALLYLEKSLEIAQEIGDRSGEGAMLSNIGLIYMNWGDYDSALMYLEKSLVIDQETGNKSGEGTTLNNISQIYKVCGDYDTALLCLEKSLVIIQEIGDKSVEVKTLGNIGQIYLDRSDYDSALLYLEKSIIVAQEIGDKSGEGAALNNISEIYKVRGNYKAALSCLEKSLIIVQEIGDKSGEGSVLNNISQIYDAHDDYERALMYLEKSLIIAEEIGNKSGEGAILHNIAMIFSEQEDYEQYLRYETKSYQILSEIGDTYGMYNVGRILGVFLCQSGYKEHGLPLLETALAISEQSQLPDTDYIRSAIEHFKNTPS